MKNPYPPLQVKWSFPYSVGHFYSINVSIKFGSRVSMSSLKVEYVPSIIVSIADNLDQMYLFPSLQSKTDWKVKYFKIFGEG